MATLSFIGVGRMGSGMAARLLEAGHAVQIFDPNTAAVEALVRQGAIATQSPAKAAQGADVVFTSLPNPAILRDAIEGPGGVLAADLAGVTIIDMSTVDPETARSLAAAAEAKGGRFVDSPVSGGVAAAAAGTLLLMVGASPEDLEKVRPYLEQISSRIVHCGPVGAGQLTKLSHNMLVAINTVAAGEVLAAAIKAGGNLKTLTEVYSAGLAGSKMLDHFGKTLFTEERPPLFALDLMHKDISLCLKEFGQFPMPVSQLVMQTYNAARAKGLGGQDSTGVNEIYEELFGLQLRADAKENNA
ncbi:NAD(P)-dependent oxidoreductase [Pseudarthrobacter sp. efr-133-R2A-89]|jgi:3-hydroxyisobutyrate dehydrogenase-like beta-hydroxyacid dehydrogenase|uniref:NAD(P)-dependent oxidoreductase n=1 Tax=Pseudarthrobacter sp. efr-133-R2A-89 TaxID=3040302 RepID=UPI002552F32B|nr:NAD(P)-dependent oxidoreductase [Pseudarthrobacter sp. efr-133-R2A-89]